MIIQWRAIKIRARSPPRKKEKKKNTRHPKKYQQLWSPNHPNYKG